MISLTAKKPAKKSRNENLKVIQSQNFDKDVNASISEKNSEYERTGKNKEDHASVKSLKEKQQELAQSSKQKEMKQERYRESVIKSNGTNPLDYDEEEKKDEVRSFVKVVKTKKDFS